MQGKYGDIAKTTVIKRLRLEENLKDKPCLKAAISTVGVHKVALVAKIATPETDKIMAENLFSMSKMAVQSLSKELRAGQNDQQLVFGDGVYQNTDRYSESKTHDSIIPFCKIHHEFAHHNLIHHETLKPEEWRISVIKEPTEKISQADLLYRKYRREILA